MLPVPYDQAIAPIYDYPQNNPPIVPAIQVHPDGMNILITAAALVANEVGATATTSTTRMFCFNMVSRDNWNNPDYANLVRLVVDYFVYKTYASSSGNSFVLLQQVVTECSSLYAAYLAYNYQEYFVQLDPAMQSRVMQNIQVFNDYLGKSESVYTLPAHQQHPQQSPHSMNMVMNRPQAHHGVHRHPASPQAGYHYPAHTVQGGHRNVGQHPAASGLTAPTAQMNARDKFISTKFTTVKPTISKPEPKQNTGGKMDQNTHSLAYRGTTVSARPTPRRPAVTQAAPVSEKAALRTALVHETEELKPVHVLVEQDIHSAFCTVDAMMSKKLTKSILEVYPFEIVSIEPMIASVKTHTLYTSLRQARTFTAVAQALKTYANYLKALALPEREDEKYFGQTLLSKVDRIITGHINHFSQNAFPGTGFKTSSVMEDGEELVSYVNGEYGRNAMNAFATFQKNLLSTLFQPDAHGEDSIPDFEAEGETQVVDYEIHSVRTLVAYFTATWNEINGGISNTRQIITPDSNNPLHPVLLKIKDAVKEVGATRVYLMTTDGLRLAFFEEVTEPGTFKITEE